MTYKDIQNLTDEELYNLSLQKGNNKCYTEEANIAYAERRRRSDADQFVGIPKTCSKWQADIDYYGYCDEDL